MTQASLLGIPSTLALPLPLTLSPSPVVSSRSATSVDGDGGLAAAEAVNPGRISIAIAEGDDEAQTDAQLRAAGAGLPAVRPRNSRQSFRASEIRGPVPSTPIGDAGVPASTAGCAQNSARTYPCSLPQGEVSRISFGRLPLSPPSHPTRRLPAPRFNAKMRWGSIQSRLQDGSFKGPGEPGAAAAPAETASPRRPAAAAAANMGQAAATSALEARGLTWPRSSARTWGACLSGPPG